MRDKDNARDDWKKKLAPEVCRITREGGTETPFSGKYWNTKETGMYQCSNCGAELFDSATKFDSGTGWPSFWAPVLESELEHLSDKSRGMERTEVKCGKCGAHLGHVFEDGPKPTGKRYCINSAALDFDKNGA